MPSDHSSPAGGDPQPLRVERDFGTDDLARLRVLVEEFAGRAGLTGPRLGNFVLAVNEIASNAIEHAGGRGHLLIQVVDNHLECRITDSGPGFSEAAIPEVPPDDESPQGRGLWMTRLITDQLTIAAGTVGAVVTLAMSRT